MGRSDFIDRSRDEQPRVGLREGRNGNIVPLEGCIEVLNVKSQAKHGPGWMDVGGNRRLVPKREREVSRSCTFTVAGYTPMINVDVANRTQHVNVGLVLLRHGILDVHETVERFLDVRFV